MNDNLSPEIQATLRKNAGWLIALSILLIGLGMIAILVPVVTTITAALVFAWVLLIGGMVRVIKAFQSKPVRGLWLNLLIGILYIIAGLILLSGPLQGAITLTLVLGLLFIFEGIYEIIMAFQVKPGGGLSWLVVLDGVITLILGIFVINRWPFDSFWLIGLYIGISLIFSGASLLAIALAAHKISTQKTLHS